MAKEKLLVVKQLLMAILLLSIMSCTKEEQDAPIEGTVTDENGPITLELTNLTATTALFKGSVNLDLYSKYEEVGVIYSLKEDLEINPIITHLVPIKNIDKNNRFEKMEGLLYGTKYYYSSYICMNGIYKYGEVQTFTTDAVTMEVSAPTVTSTTATFKGKVEVSEEDAESISFGIAWSAGNDFEMNVNEEDAELAEDGTFAVTVTGLKMDTEYHYATCIRQLGSQYGEVKKFTTAAASMSVAATQITQTSVTFTGEAERSAEDEDIEYGILYSTGEKLEVGAEGCIRKVLTEAFDDKGKFSLKVDGLMNDTKYNYCWYARQGSTYKYGFAQEFTTSSVTINLSVDPITQTTATFKGNYEQPDGEGFEIGILYALSPEGLTMDSDAAIRIELSEKNFSHKISGLRYNTTYHYCTYIRQNGDCKYGSRQEFKTRDVIVDVAVNDVTQTTATFNGKTEITETDVIEVGILYSTNSSLSVTSSSTSKIVLSSGDFSHKVDGLKNNTQYYYRHYVKYGDEYVFGETRNFMTTSVSATQSEPSVTQTTVTFIGSVNFAETTSIEFGILYSTSNTLTATSAGVKKIKTTPNADGTFSCKAEGLQFSTTYYYCYYACQDGAYTYGSVSEFTTSSVTMNLSIDSITQTTATFTGNVELTEDGLIEVGVLYSTGNNLTNGASAVTKQVLSPDSSGNISFKAEGLQYATTYNYCYYVCQNGKYTYGTVQNFTTKSVTMNPSIDAVTQTTVTFGGSVELTESGVIEVGVLYSTGDNLINGASGVTKQVLTPDLSGNVAFKAEGLQYGTTYNYCYYVCQNGKYTYGTAQNFMTKSVTMNLSADSITQTTAIFTGNVELTEDGLIEVGVLYSTGENLSIGASGVTKQELTPDSSGNVTFKAEGLQHGTVYNYCYYVCQNGKYTYGTAQNFTTVPVVINLSVGSITQTKATFTGNVELTEDRLIEVGLLYSTGSDLTISASGVTKQVLTPDSSGNISFIAEGLQYGTTYNYCYYTCQNGQYTYGTVQNFTTKSVTMNLSVDSITQTTATFTGNVELTEDGLIEVGVLYSTGSNLTVDASGVTKQVLTPDSSGNISFKAEGLQYGTTYNYCYYTYQNGQYTYGTVQNFTTKSVTMNLSVDSITQTTATFTGNVELTEDGLVEVGVLYSTGNDLTISASGVTKQELTPDSSGNVTFKAEGLQYGTTYNYCYYICQNGQYTYGATLNFTTLDISADDLSALGTANCYIVSKSGQYKIKAVKGNSLDSIGNMVSADVLWESFGTNITPEVGELIIWASCSGEYVGFEVPSDFKEGNAVIAAKDANGTILWSWHIWLTDEPQEQVYYNDAGTMMDRNLGATSATPGDVGALGLLYQWGRKDPFLGSSSISEDVVAASTLTWPTNVMSSLATGTVDYTISNPTTFIYRSFNYDWYYTGSTFLTDNSRWQSEKTIYDPCPNGWRVPDGGDGGVWSIAKGASDKFSLTFDNSSKGIDLFEIFSNDGTIWYPAAGYRDYSDGCLSNAGNRGGYWSCTPDSNFACCLYFYDDGDVLPSYCSSRADGQSVRCLKE